LTEHRFATLGSGIGVDLLDRLVLGAVLLDLQHAVPITTLYDVHRTSTHAANRASGPADKYAPVVGEHRRVTPTCLLTRKPDDDQFPSGQSNSGFRDRRIQLQDTHIGKCELQTHLVRPIIHQRQEQFTRTHLHQSDDNRHQPSQPAPSRPAGSLFPQFRGRFRRHWGSRGRRFESCQPYRKEGSRSSRLREPSFLCGHRCPFGLAQRSATP